jgi:hypothetical protein
MSIDQMRMSSNSTPGKVIVGFCGSGGGAASNGRTSGACRRAKSTSAPSIAVIVWRNRACRLNVRSSAQTNQMSSPVTSKLTTNARPDSPASQMMELSATTDTARRAQNRNFEDGKLSGPRRCSMMSTNAKIRRST